MTEVTVVVVHVVIATTEVEVVREVATAFERRRTPIATVASSVAERRPAATTSNRKEDVIAVNL